MALRGKKKTKFKKYSYGIVCIIDPNTAFDPILANQCNSLLWQCSSTCIYSHSYHLFLAKLVSIVSAQWFDCSDHQFVRRWQMFRSFARSFSIHRNYAMDRCQQTQSENNRNNHPHDRHLYFIKVKVVSNDVNIVWIHFIYLELVDQRIIF